MWTAAAVVALAASAAACKERTLDEEPCPPGGTSLTYDSFGREFFAVNCQRCHGQPIADRDGAPPEVDFGTLDAVRSYKERIFARAAADNTTMPPGPDDPSPEDRQKLAEWLACGAP